MTFKDVKCKSKNFMLSGVAVHDGKIIIAGGFNGKTDGYLCTVEMYDPDTNTWVCLPSMKIKRGGEFKPQRV